MKATLYVDGGARGNPGPAGIGVLLKGQNGEVIDERSEFIGVATNNIAEYQALRRGLDLAKDNGVSDLEIINDSELVARQVQGKYKVKNAELRKLFLEVVDELGSFKNWSIANVPREHNSEADLLVNQAIDAALI